MTSVVRTPAGGQAAWRAREHVEILSDQLAGIDAWLAVWRAEGGAEDGRDDGARSREARLDVSRRRDVLRRQHEAIVRRTEQDLTGAERVVPSAAPPPRAVLAHRSEWFRDKVGQALTGRRISVVAELDNGADAVGVCVAEQPDLLLVEDKLVMLNGEEVLRQVDRFSPATLAVAQVSHDEQVHRLLHAGARAAYTRRIPPQDVAEQMVAMVRA
jgi:hypothetical protein